MGAETHYKGFRLYVKRAGVHGSVVESASLGRGQALSRSPALEVQVDVAWADSAF